MTVLDSPGAPDTGIDALALGTAVARVRESSGDQPLFTDRYSQMLVDAAGPMEPDQAALAVPDYVAARTKWFDDFFLAASAAGLAQIVILSAGLDTRAWRLPWLDDTVIYEVDLPKTLAFKQKTLTRAGVTPTAAYVPVPVTIDDDWPRALTAAGFSPDEPTAWAAEGVYAGLAESDQDTLLERIDLYGARGSRIAMDVDADGPDVVCWLCARHWEMGSTAGPDVMTRYHRNTAGAPAGLFVEGRKL